jgi:activator of HSP90 ATPase
VKTIRFKIKLPATPQEVFDMLMDSKKHSKFTGDIAKISRKIKGKFSVFSGYAKGINKKIVEGKQIVQSWRASDWPKDSDSEVSFTFKKVKGGTELIFSQKKVPDSFFQDVKDGWDDYYWKPLKKAFTKKK